jgi:cytidylate kinase
VAAGGDSVIEGRDIAAVVAPDADVKIFLTASASERALRRARQLGMPLDEPALRMIETAIVERDSADASREASPFVQAPDAIVIDTTDMSLDEVVDAVLDAVRDGSSR